MLTFKELSFAVADNILKFILVFFRDNKDLHSYELSTRQMIHMKCQALFSVKKKKKKKKIKMFMLKVWLAL